jgi:hypothetical protein
MKIYLNLILLSLSSYIYAQNTVDVSFCIKDSVLNFNNVKQVFFIIDKDTFQLEKTSELFRYTNDFNKITDSTSVSVNFVTKSEHLFFILRKKKLNTLGFIEVCFDSNDRRFKKTFFSCSMGGYYHIAGYATTLKLKKNKSRSRKCLFASG